MTPRLTSAVLCAVVLAGGCRSSTSVGSAPFSLDPQRAGRAGAHLSRVHTPHPGLSGLALDPAGKLWAVPEQARALVPLELSGRAGSTVPLRGVPEGADTESLAWLGAGELACGLESPRDAGSVMVDGKPCDIAMFRIGDRGDAQRTGCLAFPYEAHGAEPERNHGIEGLCAAGDLLLAASETVVHRDGQRLGLLGLYDRKTGRWTAHKLRLASTEAQRGKLSALSCHVSPDSGALEVWAVERHFEVTYLLRFRVPREATAAPIPRAETRDIRPLVRGAPNFEGIAWDPKAGRLMLINDSRYGRHRVDTVLLTLLIKPGNRAQPHR